MSESKAAEDYRNFESLRNRFSDTTGASSPSRSAEPRKSSKRRFDPRVNAPPLVPLVEEGDQPPEAKSPDCTSPIKGKWKHINQTKCNHLNGPEFDALETSSTASLSSAYSEPGTFTPPLGSSLSELSDVESCETFSEYDIKRTKSRIASLKASFERSHSNNSSPTRNNRHTQFPPDADVPENFVNLSKHAWDNIIGEWVFSGITKSEGSPSRPKMRRPSSEVRVPTPLSTPLGSNDNLLLDCDSRSSILSANDSNMSDDYPNFDRRPFLGGFLNKPPSRPSSASCIRTNTAARRTLMMAEVEDRSSSETNLILPREDREVEGEERKGVCEVEMNEDSTEKQADVDDDDDILLLQKKYQLGKFLSISDTMLPVEEREHEYIAEGPKPPSPPKDERVNPAKLVKPVEPVEPAVESSSEDTEEKPTEDEIPINYEPGKFISQLNTSSSPKEVLNQDTTEKKAESPILTPPLAANRSEGDGGEILEADSPKPMPTKATPPNRWFDAYMKCKASQSPRRKLAPTKPPQFNAPPITRPLEVTESPLKAPPTSDSCMTRDEKKDDFERVQKITPSKSYKWLEAMQKYKELKSDVKQKNTFDSSQSREEESSQLSSSVVKAPQKSAEEPSFSSLAQRAQVFGGMRKKPPLRRTKSFQVGSESTVSSPLATGLTRPTRVLKKQMTASFT